MDDISRLKSLGAQAPPALEIDVTAGVMRSIRQVSSQRDDDRVFPIAAVIAAAAGVFAATSAAPTWFSTSYSFAEFGEAINLVLR